MRSGVADSTLREAVFALGFVGVESQDSRIIGGKTKFINVMSQSVHVIAKGVERRAIFRDQACDRKGVRSLGSNLKIRENTFTSVDERGWIKWGGSGRF